MGSAADCGFQCDGFEVRKTQLRGPYEEDC